MTKPSHIEVNIDDLCSAVYEAVGEGMPHVDEFASQPGFDWRTWCQDKSRMVPLVRGPLVSYRDRLSPQEQAKLKLALQYVLNRDEFSTYQAWKSDLRLKSKVHGVGARYFADYQDTIKPYDYYEFCLWIWEVLYADDDWHADVRNWSLNDRAVLHTPLNLPRPQAEELSMLQKLARRFGKL